MTAPEPVDPAKVMAEHHEMWPGDPEASRWCVACDAYWPCMPYRLAEALAEEQELRRSNSRSARKLMDAIRWHPTFPADGVPLLFGERALLVIEAMAAEAAALREQVTLWQRLAVRNARLNDALREKVQRVEGKVRQYREFGEFANKEVPSLAVAEDFGAALAGAAEQP